MTDTCPNCLQRGIAPIASRCRGQHLAHGYRCPRCHHQWAVGRLATAYPVHTARYTEALGDAA